MPNKRTREEVAKALEVKGFAKKGNASVIATSLTQRVKKNSLKGVKSPEGLICWTE
ncbi:MAG: hypothetical protein ACLFU9_04660 [Candidatus Bathyarchaeia archaeon]